MERTCEACGATFTVSAHQVKYHRGRFCSRACRFKGLSGAKNPSWKGGPVQRQCAACGMTFEVLPGVVERGGGRYCSRACYARRNTGTGNGNWRGGHIQRVCGECGATFEVWPSEAKDTLGRFCSHACYSQWRAKSGIAAMESNPNWHGGLSLEPYGADFSAALKQAVRQRDNFTCQLCGKPENGECHPVHHIDYDKKNNTPGNLITLCRSCHSKTNTGRGQWTKTFAEKVAV